MVAIGVVDENLAFTSNQDRSSCYHYYYLLKARIGQWLIVNFIQFASYRFDC